MRRVKHVVFWVPAMIAAMLFVTAGRTILRRGMTCLVYQGHHCL